MNLCLPLTAYPTWTSVIWSSGTRAWLMLLGALLLFLGAIVLLMRRYPRVVAGAGAVERMWLLASLLSFTFGMFFVLIVHPSWTAARWAWHDQQIRLVGGEPCAIDQLSTRFGEALGSAMLVLDIGWFLGFILSVLLLGGFVSVRTRRAVG